MKPEGDEVCCGTVRNIGLRPECECLPASRQRHVESRNQGDYSLLPAPFLAFVVLVFRLDAKPSLAGLIAHEKHTEVAVLESRLRDCQFTSAFVGFFSVESSKLFIRPSPRDVAIPLPALMSSGATSSTVNPLPLPCSGRRAWSERTVSHDHHEKCLLHSLSFVRIKSGIATVVESKQFGEIKRSGHRLLSWARRFLTLEMVFEVLPIDQRLVGKAFECAYRVHILAYRLVQIGISGPPIELLEPSKICLEADELYCAVLANEVEKHLDDG